MFGRPRFVHDLALPGLLHGRVLRPPSPGATLTALDDAKAKAVPGVVAVVRDGSFVGVVAETEEAALPRALKALAGGAQLAGGRAAARRGRPARLAQEPAGRDHAHQRARGRRPGAAKARTVRREYTRPYIAHASMAPSCAIAQWSGDGLQVWTHSQGIFNLRADLALIFPLPPERIVVEHAEGAGCYGHNGADDVALEAALLARAVAGRPVRLQWSREDEMAWAPVGACQAVDLEADLDEKGEIVAWRHDVWGNGHVSRPGRGKTPTLQAAWQLAKPFPRLRWRSTRRWPAAAARSATPRRSTISRPGASPTTACSPCRSAPRRCARSAPSPTCSPSSRSWTSWPPSAARTRSPSACAT